MREPANSQMASVTTAGWNRFRTWSSKLPPENKRALTRQTQESDGRVRTLSSTPLSLACNLAANFVGRAHRVHIWIAPRVYRDMTSLTASHKCALGVALLLLVAAAVGQHGQAQAPAQVGIASPLPVYVTNTPSLPDGFTPGSRWKFSTWTMPSVLSWTATVNRTSGGWAHLTVNASDGATVSRWYYLPAMEGSWEQQ
jgi:hypothetical protein